MRILWLKTELLHPLDKGGRIRTYHMLCALRRDHHITYLTLDDGTAAPDAAERAAEYCHDLECIPFRTTPKNSWKVYGDLLLNVASGLPYAVAKYRSSRMEDAIRRRLRDERYDVVVCDFLFPSRNMPDGVDCPTVLFQHNVEAAIWERHAAVAGSTIKRAYLREQWRRMVRIERRECRRFDHVVAVSEADAETMEREYALPNVSWVPTGVDTEFFRPEHDYPAGGRDIVFTGAMDWLPNEDAIVYFAGEILPRVRARVPDAELVLVGRNPTPRVEHVASTTPGVRLVGRVPDVRAYVDAAAVFVVPIRVGGGTRLKVFEAMAMERPVVSTTVGVEGLPVADGDHVMIADDAERFANAVVTVLSDPVQAAALGRRGAQYVREHFAWDSVAEQFAQICERVASREHIPARVGSGA
jgi:sugar transferase (PEP-CTERM/EpsH1 system associated)